MITTETKEQLSTLSQSQSQSKTQVQSPSPLQSNDPFDAKGFIGLVADFHPILEGMTARGIPINVTSLEDLSLEIDKELEVIKGQLNAEIPAHLRRVQPKDGYKRPPKEVMEAIADWTTAKDAMANIDIMPISDPVILSIVEEAVKMPLHQYITNKTGLIARKFQTPPEQIPCICTINEGTPVDSCKQCQGLGVILSSTEVARWCKEKAFNPNSSQQVSDYIAYNKHTTLAKQLVAKLGFDEIEESGEEPSPTNKVVLKKLAQKTGNNVYTLIVSYRELVKVKDTFIAGWTPSKTETINKLIKYSANDIGTNRFVVEPVKIGRVYPTFGFRPATGQLNSYNPNAQNQIKHSELGKRFRNCIEAYPNHTLVEFDMSGFHALMMGFLAKDQDYIRLARIDIHSYTIGWCLHYEDKSKGITMANCLDLPDDELKAYLSQIKKQYSLLRTKQAKPILLGRQLGLSESGAFERYKEDFMPSVEEVLKTFKRIKPTDVLIQERREKVGREEVKKIYAVFDKIFPKPKAWQKQILKQANELGMLKSAYGFVRRFWNVEEPKYDAYGNFQGTRRGEQAEQALAQLIQNSAFGHMRQIMLKLEQLGYNERYRLINTIHDSLVFECPDELLNECLVNVKRVMQSRSKLLKNEIEPLGFYCEVEVQVGKRFGDMKEKEVNI